MLVKEQSYTLCMLRFVQKRMARTAIKESISFPKADGYFFSDKVVREIPVASYNMTSIKDILANNYDKSMDLYAEDQMIHVQTAFGLLDLLAAEAPLEGARFIQIQQSNDILLRVRKTGNESMGRAVVICLDKYDRNIQRQKLHFEICLWPVFTGVSIYLTLSLFVVVN